MSEPIVIPSSWLETQVSEVCERIHYGYTDSADHEGTGLKFLRISDIQNGLVNWNTVPACNLALDKADPYLLQKGDILFARTGGTVGKSFLIAHDPPASVFASYLIRLIPSNGINSAYISQYFQSSAYWAQIELNKTGLKTNVNASILGSLQLPLPPLNEQKRIVAKIEELFSELDAGEESLRKARRQLGVYRQSLLKQAFEGKLTAAWREQNPDILESPADFLNLLEEGSKRSRVQADQVHDIPSWSYRTLDELTEFITSGSRGWAEYYSDSGSLFIRAQNLNRDFLNLDDIAFVSPPQSAEGRRTQVKYGDLLITITGANTTKSGWVNTHLEDAYVSQHVALCRPVSDKLSEFIYRFVISSAGGRKKLEKDAYGAGKPGLNLDNVRSLVVPIPSLPEQQEIVRLLDEQFTVIEQNEREIDTALKRSEVLRQSILKKAFSGQLVAQDPADEPAGVLLERIRAERQLTDRKIQKKSKI